ncbi:acyl-CoA dehydrogenase family protein [Leucobacter luti]|uniref:Alkylation response protein AidB-like acyl-CoA dehydrogenase n=1 Tax=Leucobacter luti TaxID=340320 RepID=A0A4R6S3X1_9MICO|nr:acyl-CoA dehydrogenase family protein [Leucobacter luti]MCW2287150.1 alkylation response protein AidB-like acyl-CoA dehydrogenase [Leucobacter luti]QYM76758.1 acyl-CoA/acyl-ACP dehydrogenase [Leucobacter luti]TCK41376.1 alkylation response protein AidB-like acyl-CoA dehydrogenase [Leucobacter luti]TDP94350.1 alkylation response protein AidB-like acyl-CoA dehydrogenase [Leucobacter luti]
MTDRETRHAELAERYLPEGVLERFRARAAETDRANEFFSADLAELTERGYLTLFVPEAWGGPGLTLHEVSRLQQRLATAAPATALAINMHLMCTGVARAMQQRGDDSLTRVFEEAMAGEIFAFGISEPGNDWVLSDSTTVAAPQPDGGYLLTGTKIFTSLSPVWTRLMTHGVDASTPEQPELVFGFVERSAPGITVSDRWDVLGMRASQSRATRLDGVPMRAERVIRRLPVGPQPDLLPFAIAANFQLLIASVYAGVARRALDVAAAGLKQRRSAKAGTTLAEVPESRVRLADAHLDYLVVPALLDSTTRDFDELIDHGAAWSPRLVGARLHATSAARRTAEVALLCTGGSGFDSGHEASRLYRDAAAGMFHPPAADAARPLFAAALLDEG